MCVHVCALNTWQVGMDTLINDKCPCHLVIIKTDSPLFCIEFLISSTCVLQRRPNVGYWMPSWKMGKRKFPVSQSLLVWKHSPGYLIMLFDSGVLWVCLWLLCELSVPTKYISWVGTLIHFHREVCQHCSQKSAKMLYLQRLPSKGKKKETNTVFNSVLSFNPRNFALCLFPPPPGIPGVSTCLFWVRNNVSVFGVQVQQ